MNTTPAIAPELLTLPQAAKYLGIGQRTLARWSAERKAPAALKLTPGQGVR
jgi:predicted DNA-binding transcriptional regulator AlpA